MSMVQADAARMWGPEFPRSVRLAIGMVEQLKRGKLRVTLPDGRELEFYGKDPGPSATIIINEYRFARRLLMSGDLGLAESYLRGEWDSPDLPQFLLLFCLNYDLVADTLTGSHPVRLWHSFRHWLRRNTRRQARRNIRAHYDLGNSFYAEWLDEGLTYSAALFEKEESDLFAAQQHKYTALADRMDLKPDATLLEIGCGWGGFAEFAAKTYGVKVVGLTISRQQHDHACRRIRDAGLNEKVAIKLQDYRDERGVYDRIASIEMIEAVGERYWPAYFSQLRDRLAEGGRVGLQAITIEEAVFAQYKREMDFIRAYIFPGGMLPTWSILHDFGRRCGFGLVSERRFGEDYARTIVEWRLRFRRAWPRLQGSGFDEPFGRLWEYYLAYCEAGFRSRRIDVGQIVFAKP